MIIPRVLKNNIGLPWCFYYLGVAEYLLQEAREQCKNKDCLWSIDAKIQEIQKYISIAIVVYGSEEKTPKQTRGFCKKKQKIKSDLDRLQANLQRKKQRIKMG